ncbi:MAG: VOC family protein [Pseudomonadota bacterium]|nr:VOC family protein [Pseudomonadota bacterium]
MIKIISPLEVGICVNNLKQMVNFYKDRLGFRLISEIEVGPAKSKEAGFTKDGYTIVRLQTNFGERIKLVRPNSNPEKRSTGNEVLSRSGNVFLTFIVSDLKLTLDNLSTYTNNVRTENCITEVRDGVFLSIIDDPEGNHLELVEYSNIQDYRDDLN